MNYILAIGVVVAYIAIHANKEGKGLIPYILANKLNLAVVAGVMFAVTLAPKFLTGAAIVAYVLPLVSTWGIVSTVNNAIDIVKGFFTKVLNFIQG